jgi:hypothetical protein
MSLEAIFYISQSVGRIGRRGGPIVVVNPVDVVEHEHQRLVIPSGAQPTYPTYIVQAAGA